MEIEQSIPGGQDMASSSAVVASEFHNDGTHDIRQNSCHEAQSHLSQSNEEEGEDEPYFVTEEQDLHDSLELPENTFRSRHHLLLSQMNMSPEESGDGFPDIQFFHKQIQGNMFHPGFDYDSRHGAGQDQLDLDSNENGIHHMDQNMDERSNDSQDNPFVFPGDVMEYGEPQFFPGNCVGYLETILEETDEEYEEEEGCSGRHWWTADSDTDTDSVIRVDNNPGIASAHHHNPFVQATSQHFSNHPALNFYRPANGDFQPSRLGIPGCSSAQTLTSSTTSSSTFRTTASSRPFEMEDIDLLDQLDLAFEQTLMESPRRRPANQYPQPTPPEKPFESEPTSGEALIVDAPCEDKKEEQIEIEITTHETNNQQSHPSPTPPAESSVFHDYDDDVEPAEVNEEDFFRSSPEPDDEEEESSQDSSSSSSGEGCNEGVVLAEFSLNSSFSSAVNQRHRRSFDGSSIKIRSFRSFDSLNCLSGTELLFSKADTFPSFHDIKEVVEESERAEANSEATVIANPGARDLKSEEEKPRQLRTVRTDSDSSQESRTVAGTDDRQNNMSSENLSEDSGIGGDPNGGSGLNLNLPHHQSVQPMSSLSSTDSSESPSFPPFIPKSEFALNPFVFSSLSSTSEGPSSNFYQGNQPVQDSSITRSNPELLDPSAPPPDLVAHCAGPLSRKHSLDSYTEIIDTALLRKLSNSEVLLKFRDEDEMLAEVDGLTSSCQIPNGGLSESIHLQIRPEDECLVLANKAILPPVIVDEQRRPFIQLSGVNKKDVVIDAEGQLDITNNETQLRPMSPTIPNEHVQDDAISCSVIRTRGDSLRSQDQQQRKDDELEEHDANMRAPTTVSPSFEFEHTQFASSDVGMLDQGEDSPPPASAPNLLLHHPNKSPSQNSEPVVNTNSAWTDVVAQDSNNTEPEPDSKPAPTTKTTTLVVKFISVAPKITSSAAETAESLPPSSEQSVPSSQSSCAETSVPQEPFQVSPPVPTMEATDSPVVPIKTKVYGPRNEVEVFLVSSRTPSPIMKPVSPSPDGGKQLGGKKEVHFSPVVSEISWRESYIDQQSSASSDPALDEPESSVDDVLEKSQDRSALGEDFEDTPPVEIVKIISSTQDSIIRSKSPSPRPEPQHSYEDVEISAPSPNQLSMVPDLLSQCENLSPSHTHISINIEPKNKINKPRAKTPPPSPPPRSSEQPGSEVQKQQTQIFPAKFADKSKKSSSSLPAASPKKEKENAGGKSSKPGFFERLSKIRLSGGSKKKKIHPNDASSPVAKNMQVEESKSHTKDGGVGGPQQRPHAEILDLERSHETFESILDDIAGINAIKSRQSNTLPREKQVRTFAQRKQFLQTLPGSRGERDESASPTQLEEKLQQFTEETSRNRNHISQSHPDLEIIQGVVREEVSHAETSPMHTTKSETHLPKSPSPGLQPDHLGSPPHPNSTQPKTEREWYKLLKTAAEKYYYRGAPSEQKSPKTGIVETDLDTGTSREMLDLDSERVELVKVPCSPSSTAKTQSLTNLSRPMPLSLPPHHRDQDSGHLLPSQGDFSEKEDRAKSYEFLLDENHKSSSVPPENQLRQENRQLSEHELRIQRSLQKLNVPEWYKNSQSRKSPGPETEAPKATTLSKRSEFGSGSGLAGGWAGLSAYKTSSLSSLQYNGRWGGSINRGSNFVRGRPATMSTSAVRTSKESLLSPSSTASQSSSAFERCSFTYGMPFNQTRYGQGRFSTGTASISPPSTPVNPNPTYTKKPYLGWRSQERLGKEGQPIAINTTSNLKLSLYRPPAERLAADLLSGRPKLSLVKPVDRPPLPKPPPRSSSNTDHSEPLSSVHDSIREVSEQINQFVNKDAFESPKPLPRHKRSNKPPVIWMESSFVGTKPTA